MITALFYFYRKSYCQNKTMKSTDAKAPIADKKSIKLEKHGDVRIDDYFWMRLSDEQKKAELKDEQTLNVVDYLGLKLNKFINLPILHSIFRYKARKFRLKHC